MIKKELDNIPEFIAGDKTHLKEVLHPKNDNIDLDYSLAHASIKIGQSSLPHQLEFSETYFFLEGTGKMFINDEYCDVKKGDTVYVPPKANQYVENTGKTDLIFICIVSPPWTENSEIVY